jgi:hypothetical protein
MSNPNRNTEHLDYNIFCVRIMHSRGMLAMYWGISSLTTAVSFFMGFISPYLEILESLNNPLPHYDPYTENATSSL